MTTTAGLLLVLWGCALAPDAAIADERQGTADALGVELPDGEGKTILERACTNCHDLGGLELFRGYYDEELWRSLVVDMVRVGAQLREDEIDTVAKYLATHFGQGGLAK